MAYGMTLEGRNFNVVSSGNPAYGLSINGVKTDKAPSSLIKTLDINKAEYLQILDNFRSKNSSDRGRRISLDSFSGFNMYYVGYNQYDPVFGLMISNNKVGSENLISNINKISKTSTDSKSYNERKDQKSDYKHNAPYHLVSSYNSQIQNWENAKRNYDNAMNMARMTGRNPGYVYNPGNPPIYSGPTGRVDIERYTTRVYLKFSTLLNIQSYIHKNDFLNYLNSLKDSALSDSNGWVRGRNLSIHFEELYLESTTTKYVTVNHNGRYYSVSGEQTQTSTKTSHSKQDIINGKLKSVFIHDITLF